MLVSLGTPPTITKPRGGAVVYSDYEPWLRTAFFYRLCAYCLLHDGNVQVDHHEPKKYPASKGDHPSNLLPACFQCNRGKSDYHPLHKARKRAPEAADRYSVIDVRVEDFALLFSIDSTGRITARAGPKSREAWNLTLLGLDLEDNRSVARRNVFDLLRGAQKAFDALSSSDPKRAEIGRYILDALLPELAQRSLFFKVYGVPVPPELLARMEASRESAIARGEI